MAKGMTEDMVKDITLDDADGVNYYILGRETNIGYVCFESDSDIVNGVAKVFPVFFILVAVLVCMTTMNRMVEEQRSMIGMLKALGYGKAAIMGKVYDLFGNCSCSRMCRWISYRYICISRRLSGMHII